MYLYCKTILLLHIIKPLKLKLQFQPLLFSDKSLLAKRYQSAGKQAGQEHDRDRHGNENIEVSHHNASRYIRTGTNQHCDQPFRHGSGERKNAESDEHAADNEGTVLSEGDGDRGTCNNDGPACLVVDDGEKDKGNRKHSIEHCRQKRHGTDLDYLHQGKRQPQQRQKGQTGMCHIVSNYF